VGKATLLVLQGVDQGTRFEIDDLPVSLGRGVRNEVRIPDTEVSRQHAVITPHPTPEGGAFVIEDRGSSNGTFVNGQAVERHELKGGDRVQVGRTLLLFLESKESPERVAADRVELQAEIGQRSSIVSRIERNAGDTLLRQSVDPDSRQLSRSLSNLRTLYRISEEITRPSASLDQLLKQILDLTLDSVGADRGCVLLTDPDDPAKLVPRALSYRGHADVGDRMPVSRSIVDYVIRKGQGVRTTDAARTSGSRTEKALCGPVSARRCACRCPATARPSACSTWTSPRPRTTC
jgi:pSer/pThr/pTyr-binding forkhead associated (FHA) protein